MPAYKEDNGTWTSKFKYKDWRGEKRQKTKRGFERKKDALDFETEFKATFVHSADIPFTALAKNYLGDLTKNHKIEITTAERKQRAFDKMISPYFWYETYQSDYGAGCSELADMGTTERL